MHEDHFRHSSHPTIQRVWKERIAPYIQDEIYTVAKLPYFRFQVRKCTHHFNFKADKKNTYSAVIHSFGEVLQDGQRCESFGPHFNPFGVS